MGKIQMSETLRLEILNDRREAFVVLLEPWGEDYTILPGQQFELVATGTTGESRFHTEHRSHCLAVWVRGPVERIEVFAEGGEIHGGHQRQRGSEFG